MAAFARARRFGPLALSLWLAFAPAPARAIETEAEAGWRLLKQPGAVALMRHADAPGTGDPSEFTLGDCATQRNLGAEGRAQAASLGQEFRRRGVAVSQMLVSQWCRTRDTATLMGLAAPVADAPDALNSFFERRSEREAATAALRRRLQALPTDAAAVVMVTHQVNITALTGVFPQSGEMVVLQRGSDGAHRPVARLQSR